MPVAGAAPELQGVSVALLGATLASAGLLQQKRAARAAELTPAKQYYQLPAWWLGFAVFLCGHVCCFLSLALVPQATLACVSSWSVCVACFGGHLWLGEPFGRRQLAGILCLLVGIVIVTVCGPQVRTAIAPGEAPGAAPGPLLEAENVMYAARHGWATGRVPVALGVILGFFLASRAVGHAVGQGPEEREPLLNAGPAKPPRHSRAALALAVLAAASVGWCSTSCAKVVSASVSLHLRPHVATRAMSLVEGPPRAPLATQADRLVYDAAVDLATAANSAMQRAGATLRGPALVELGSSATASEALPWPCIALLLAACVAMALGNVHLLNRALAKGDAVTVLPLYEACATSGQIIVGGLIFLEFTADPQFMAGYFGAGVLCVVSGAAILAARD